MLQYIKRTDLMIVLRDVAGSDESMYQALQSDLDLTDYLSRFCPYNSSVANYDTSKVCCLSLKKTQIALAPYGLKEMHKSLIL